MALDYKRNYKTKLIRRRIVTIISVVAVFLVASFAIIYLKLGRDDAKWKPFSSSGSSSASSVDVSSSSENLSDVSSSSSDSADASSSSENSPVSSTAEPLTTAMNAEDGGKKGLAISRQPIYLYTIGVARINLSNVNREFVLNEERVDDSYFDDALFIGDSRTEGFMMYASLENIHAYCSKGLSISRIYEEEIVKLEDGRTVTVMEALQYEHYSKIYIMFGVNELGWVYDDKFIEQYGKLVRDVQQLQPDAMIYVQNILPISAERSSTDQIYNNDNVNRFNRLIEQVCKEQNVVYLDVAGYIADDTGALPADASSDGIHCNGEYCDKWLEYLRNNTYTAQDFIGAGPE